MQLWQHCLLVTAKSLYMFRTLSASIIRSTKTVVAATGSCHRSGWYISGKDVHGRLPLQCSAVQLQLTMDILTGYISSRPMTWTSGCYYSFCTPDDGRTKRPKHVEW